MSEKKISPAGGKSGGRYQGIKRHTFMRIPRYYQSGCSL
jgi:hypothetical protein